MHRAPFFGLAAVVFATSAGRGQTPDHVGPKAVVSTIEARLKALEAEFEARQTAYYKASGKASTDAERLQVVKTLYPDDLAYARRFLALAREDPRNPAVPDALYAAFQAVGHPPFRVPKHPALAIVHEQLALAQEILEWLDRDYAADPRMAHYIQQIGLTSGPRVEALLRDVLAKNSDRTAQGLACQALANLLGWTAEGPEYFAKNPGLVAEYEQVQGRAMLDWLKSHNPTAALAEAESLHERVLARYADVRIFPAYPQDNQTIRQASEKWLGSHRELMIGKPAPEIAGTDIDGKSFKLSDYRGKVVVVVFWASWCGPCMQQIPSERDLAARMEGRPFALLGVNSDYKLDAARTTMAKEKITWPNWYDGDPREEAPIGTRYHILGIPAIFVLDAQGIIRARDVRGDSLGREVEILLKELESSAKK